MYVQAFISRHKYQHACMQCSRAVVKLLGWFLIASVQTGQWKDVNNGSAIYNVAKETLITQQEI